MGQIEALLAHKGYEVTETSENVLRIRELETGIPLQAVLEGNILYLSLTLATPPASAVTPEVMKLMLSGTSGVSTSYFQLYETDDGRTAVTLNNFCKLQEMGPDDEDDILSCVQFLMADLLEARELLPELAGTASA